MVGRISSLFITLLILNSCASRKLNNAIDLSKNLAVEEISKKVYMDKAEITFQDWNEYRYWLKKVYGEKSNEFKASDIDLDTLFIELSDLFPNCLTSDYLSNNQMQSRHKEYPLIGVTHEQALDYSRWRADRLMESILIKLGNLELNSSQTRENHFSIERLFNGQVKLIKELNFEYYPVCRLPSEDEYRMVYKSEQAVKEQKNTGTERAECNLPTFNCDEVSSIKGIHFLNGNVSEWTDSKNKAIGNSFKHEYSEDLGLVIRHENKASSTKGFRNIIEWKKMNGDVDTDLPLTSAIANKEIRGLLPDFDSIQYILSNSSFDFNFKEDILKLKEIKGYHHRLPDTLGYEVYYSEVNCNQNSYSFCDDFVSLKAGFLFYYSVKEKVAYAVNVGHSYYIDSYIEMDFHLDKNHDLNLYEIGVTEGENGAEEYMNVKYIGNILIDHEIRQRRQ